MKTNRCFFIRLFFALSLLFLFSHSVQAETTNCTAITSLPYTITTQGIYCLTSDLSTSMTAGSAILIDTNNVVIDLNGHKLGGLAAGAGTDAYGIGSASMRNNITIRNGTIRGFYVGIALYGGQGHLIEGIRADMNKYTGIDVRGQSNIIRNNQVVNTGGSTYNVGDVYGILVYGTGARVLNNDVIETRAQSGHFALSIEVYTGDGVVVENNRVGNSSLGPGISYGIIAYPPSTNALVSDNCVTTMDHGVVYYTSGSTGKYRNNLTSGVTNPFSGGTDAGNNN